jgi:D-alanyl-D-alanine carboxypeptidase
MPSPTRSLLADVSAWADGWLAHRQRTLGIPGVQAAIAWGGELLLNTGHGIADLSTGAPLTPAHLFRVASHSKTFTATAIFQLYERGALRLDDTLGSRLPWTADAPYTPLSTLTLREMLSHGAGVIRDGVDGDYWQLRHPYPDEAALRDLVRRDPVIFPPNDRFKYSNIAFSLLGLVIERLTGCPYGDHVWNAIIHPLGLRDTYADYYPARAADYASGHTHSDNGAARIPIDQVPTNAMAPAAGFTSTAADLCRYFAAHRLGDPRLLSDTSKRRMQHPQWRTRDQEAYGLGLALRYFGDSRLAGHSGGYPGHTSKTWFDPRAGFAVSVLTNCIDGPDLATGLVQLIDHVSGLDRAPSVPQGIDPRRFGGRYVDLWGTYDITYLDGHLLLISLDSNYPVESVAELTVETGDRVRLTRAPDGYLSEGEPLGFDFDAGGAVTRVRGLSGVSAFPQHVYEREFLGRPRVSQRLS